MLVHVNHSDTVEPQEYQVHKVFLRDLFGVQMSVHQPKPAETPPAASALGQIGYVERVGSSEENRFDTAVAADEQSHLAA